LGCPTRLILDRPEDARHAMVDQNNRPATRYAQIILDNISDGVFAVDPDYRITLFNHAAEHITGVPSDEAMGRYCFEVFQTSACEDDCPLRQTFESGCSVTGKRILILDSVGKPIPVSVSTAVLRDEDGPLIGGMGTFRDRSVVCTLRKALEARHRLSDIISKNAQMQRIFSTLPRIAESDCCVLIQGESGTGKELFARVIHDLSLRRKHKMVVVNCGALPDTLLESELFGHKAGAFTDAKHDRIGRFARANRGTLMLDEIGDLSPAFQVRLLRVLQDHVFEPLGASHTEKTDVRILAATNRDLAGLVEEGQFRQDLYFRINVIRINIPPLRDRMDDVSLLCRHFIQKYNHLMGRNVKGISGDVMRRLMRHDFPGNVRELENIIEHAMVLCTGDQLEPDHLPVELTQSRGEVAPRDSLDGERLPIMEALKRCDWNRRAAAEDLGIHKATLYRKIKALDIRLPSRDGRSHPA